jgi:hypothetical protein
MDRFFLSPIFLVVIRLTEREGFLGARKKPGRGWSKVRRKLRACDSCGTALLDIFSSRTLRLWSFCGR